MQNIHSSILCSMAANPETRPRLSRSDWLEVSLALLQDDGINAVTIDALAEKLGITRGSFYHHFKDRHDLYKEMLDYWKLKWTVELRNDVEALGLDGRQSLIALGNLIHHRNAAGYDIAFRAWAVHDERARKFVTETDKIRLDFVRRQFEKVGFNDLDLENRSRLFLYYAMSEPGFLDPPEEETTRQLDQVRLNFLTSK